MSAGECFLTLRGWLRSCVLCLARVQLNMACPPVAIWRYKHSAHAGVTIAKFNLPLPVRAHCSVKSNDEKRALTMDQTRVQHQVKYLGLAENIKVRRAGFAYRNDFHRFLDRFAILSSATYPEWRGSDIVSDRRSAVLLLLWLPSLVAVLFSVLVMTRKVA
jgi:hypothetical protein